MTSAIRNGGQRVLGNVTVLWGGQVIQLASMVLWTALVARYMGSKNYGIYASAQAMVSILLILVNLGLDQLLLRDLAQRPEQGMVYRLHMLRLKIGIGMIVLGGFIAINWMQDGTPELKAITAIVTINGLVGAIGASNTSMINAREAMHYGVLAQSVNALITLITGVIGVWLHWPFAIILLLSLCATCIYVIIGALSVSWVYRRVSNSSSEYLTSWRATLSLALKSIPFGVLVVISVLSANLGIILLQQFQIGADKIGYFAAALRINSMVLLIPGVLGDALFPGLSRLFAGNERRFGEVFELAWRLFFSFSVPMAVGLWLVARDVLLLIYGPEFAEAVRLLQILSLVLLSGVSFVTGRAMVAMNHQKLSAGIQGVVLIVVGGMAWWAIPQYGAQGVAMAMVGGTLTGLIVFTTLLFRWLQLRFPFVWCAKTVIAAGAMGAISTLVQVRTNSLLLVLIAAPMVYALTHLALKTLSRNDWTQIVDMLPSRLKPSILWVVQRTNPPMKSDLL